MGREMTIELAWLAGIIEGEGCISPCGPNQWRVGVKMTDLDVIERVQRVAGCGNIAGPVTPTNGNKPQWTWTVSKGHDVVELLETLLPLLGERRQERAREVLAWWPTVVAAREERARVCPNGHPKGENTRPDGRCAICRAAWFKKNDRTRKVA